MRWNEKREKLSEKERVRDRLKANNKKKICGFVKSQEKKKMSTWQNNVFFFCFRGGSQWFFFVYKWNTEIKSYLIVKPPSHMHTHAHKQPHTFKTKTNKQTSKQKIDCQKNVFFFISQMVCVHTHTVNAEPFVMCFFNG